MNVLAVASVADHHPDRVLRDVLAALQRDPGRRRARSTTRTIATCSRSRSCSSCSPPCTRPASWASSCGACCRGSVLFPIAQISYSLYLVHEMFMLWLFPKTALHVRPRARGPRHDGRGGGDRARHVVCRRDASVSAGRAAVDARARSLPAVRRFSGVRAPGSALTEKQEALP